MSEARRDAARDPEDEGALLRVMLQEIREGRGPLLRAREALEDAREYLAAAQVIGELSVELNDAACSPSELFLVIGPETRICGPDGLEEALRDLAMDRIWDECLYYNNKDARARGWELYVDWEDADALTACWGLRRLNAGNPLQRRGDHWRFPSAEAACDWIGF